MKKFSLITIVIVITLLVFGCSGNKTQINEEQYTIKGNISELNDSLIYLIEYINREPVVLDSALVSNNQFEFKGKVDLPQVFLLSNKGNDFNIPVFIENTEILVKGKISLLDSMEISGSSYHNKLKSYKSNILMYDHKLKSIADKYYLARDNNLKDSMEIYEKGYDYQDSIKLGYVISEVKNNTSNVFGLYLVSKYILPTANLIELQELMVDFGDSLKASKYYNLIDQRINILKSTEIGQIAPNFIQNSINDEQIELSSFRGKYLLIDFWASWCKPCRQENPNVVAAYKKFNRHNFEILGISLDNDSEKWEKAVEDDNLIWTQVSDLKGWKNEVAQMYGVNSIPHSILVDTNGVIIAKNLRGDSLHNKLEELFKKLNQ